MNDIWTFDPTTTLWTWVGGDSEPNQIGDYSQWRTPSQQVIVGARNQHAMVVQSSTGNLMIFGGQPAVYSAGGKQWFRGIIQMILID